MSADGTLRAEIAAALSRLAAEHEAGVELLAQLETQAREVREQLLRVEGALKLGQDLLLTDAP